MKQNYTNNFLKYIFISFLVVSLGIQITSAQDPVLYDHTWYMEKVFFEDEEYYISNYTDYTGTTEFTETGDYTIHVLLCGFDWFYSIPDFSTTNPHQFSIPYIEYNPFGKDCEERWTNYPNFEIIREAIFSVFFDWNASSNIKNPFTYTITQSGNEFFLVIENVDGDKIYYSSEPLNVTEQPHQDFVVYPNPFKDNLNIENLQPGSAFSVQILDVNGALILRKDKLVNLTEINLKYLNKGIYFMVLEDSLGKKQTKKLIKK